MAATPVMSATNNSRRPIFKFETRAVEDRAASEAAKHPVMVDEHWVMVSQAGSKDWCEFPAEQWLAQMEQESRFRPKDMPSHWVEGFREDFRKWKAGETLEVRGTPVRSATFLTPAEILNLTRIQIYSVEDAAAMNDECMRMYGMGGLRVREKCQTFLASRESEKAVYETNMLRERCAQQDEEIKQLREKTAAQDARLAALEALLEQQTAPSGKPKAR